MVKKIHAWKYSTMCLICSMKLASFQVYLVFQEKTVDDVVDKK